MRILIVVLLAVFSLPIMGLVIKRGPGGGGGGDTLLAMCHTNIGTITATSQSVCADTIASTTEADGYFYVPSGQVVTLKTWVAYPMQAMTEASEDCQWDIVTETDMAEEDMDTSVVVSSVIFGDGFDQTPNPNDCTEGTDVELSATGAICTKSGLATVITGPAKWGVNVVDPDGTGTSCDGGSDCACTRIRSAGALIYGTVVGP